MVSKALILRVAFVLGALFVTTLAERVLAQPRARVLVAIGQNVGGIRDETLRYAERDAERMTSVLQSLGGVSSSNTHLVKNASAASVRSTFGRVRAYAEKVPVGVVIVFVSTHADRSGLKLGATRLEHAELRELVASVPAKMRLLVVDACDSGAIIRRKGGKQIRPFAIDVESAPSLTGSVVITSAGPDEPAQEWDSLGGSLFSYHLVSALRGAADRDLDGRVTLFETYSYVYERTLIASTAGSAGPQRPAHDMNVRGTGDLVLTRPGGKRSGLVFDDGISGRYVVSPALGGELVAEVDKVPNKPLRLALDPGRYIIRKPEGRFVRVGEVFVPPGGLATLSDSQMDRVPYTEVARRGNGPFRRWAIELGAGVGLPTVPGADPGARIALEGRRELGVLDTALGLTAVFDEFVADSVIVSQRELWLSADARVRWPLPSLLPYLGVHAGAGWIHQSLEPGSELEDPSFDPDFDWSARDGLAGQALATAGVEVPLGERSLLRVETAGGLTVFDADGANTSARPAAWLRGAAGWRW